MASALKSILAPVVSLFTGGSNKDELNRAMEEQAAAQRAATASAEEARKSADAMQRNMAADLSNPNQATVVAAGSADAATASDLLKKKKPGVGGLSSTLGIQV